MKTNLVNVKTAMNDGIVNSVNGIKSAVSEIFSTQSEESIDL